MDSNKYLERKSMQRQSLLESDCFIYWKNIFETYVKAKDLDIWHIILNGDFPSIAKNEVTQVLEIVPYEQQDDNLKRKLSKNNEAKMVLYNALPKKEYEIIFMCKTAKDIWQSLLITHQGNSQVKDNKIDLLVQQYEQFTILEEESIDSGFARFNTIITSLKALNEGNQEKKRSHSDKGMRKKERVIRNALDAMIQIISLVIIQNHHATKIKRPSLEALGAIAKMTPRTKLTTCLMAQSSNEVTFNYSYYSDNASSLDDDESHNMTFDESPPPTKLSPVDDDVGEEEAIENDTKVVNNNNEEVPLPMSETIRGTKWVFRNKFDENGIMSRNKARLVAQGYNQQEGIYYDETYALVARLESIRILLAIACANDFKLYQMDVKNAILNGFINEDVYVAQPLALLILKNQITFINLKRLFMVLRKLPGLDFEKIMHNEFEMSMIKELNLFLGLQIKQMEDEIFFNQSKYIKEMLKKFGLEDSKPTKTPMSTEIKLTKDDEADSVDRTKYRALAISTTEAEYVFVEKAWQQALWMKQALIDYDIRLGTKMPSEYQQDYKKTLAYAPKIYNDPNMTEQLKDIYRALESRKYRDHTQEIIALMLYCIENGQPFNLAYFIIRRMYYFRNQREKVLPYGMILTPLFKNLKSNMVDHPFDELYILVPRKMSSLKAKQLKMPPPKRTRNV
nr:copia protein [Tanacetum cinerariifolium]